jgi:hypothetical protein
MDTIDPNFQFTVSDTSPCKFVTQQPSSINFVAYNTSAKSVMWIDPQGKIHVDPEMAADEVARRVCEVLATMYAGRGVCSKCGKSE